MYRFVIFLLIFLSACEGAPTPAPLLATTAPKPVTLALATLFDDPQLYVGRLVTLITPVATVDGQSVLVAGLRTTLAGTVAITDTTRTVALAAALPPAIIAQLTQGTGYLKVRGRLSPPGGYGPNARYAYQFAIDTVGVVQSERTTLRNLTLNRAALDDVLLAVRGTLLTSTNGNDAILTEGVASGGVPASEAQQIKLLRLPDSAITQQLTASGTARYGLVDVVGWWDNGALVPFIVESAHDTGGPTPTGS